MLSGGWLCLLVFSYEIWVCCCKALVFTMLISFLQWLWLGSLNGTVITIIHSNGLLVIITNNLDKPLRKNTVGGKPQMEGVIIKETRCLHPFCNKLDNSQLMKSFLERLFSHRTSLSTWKAPKVNSGRRNRPLPWFLWISQAPNITYLYPVFCLSFPFPHLNFHGVLCFYKPVECVVDKKYSVHSFVDNMLPEIFQKTSFSLDMLPNMYCFYILKFTFKNVHKALPCLSVALKEQQSKWTAFHDHLVFRPSKKICIHLHKRISVQWFVPYVEYVCSSWHHEGWRNISHRLGRLCADKVT